MGVSTVSLPRFAVTCFVLTGVPFGAAMGALGGLLAFARTGSATVGASVGAATAVVAGTLFGTAMTLTLGMLHRSGAVLPSGALAAVRQSDVFSVPGDMGSAEVIATDALDQIGIRPSRRVEGDVVVLEGRTETSWKSWGEVVRIELGPGLGGTVPIHVTSRPSLRTTIADYGKNLANVVAIRAAMGARDVVAA